VSAGYVRRLLRLAFVAPAIVEAIVEELSAQRLLTRTAFLLQWGTQKRVLGLE
jgi:hypothetical protein